MERICVAVESGTEVPRLIFFPDRFITSLLGRDHDTESLERNLHGRR